MKTALTWAGSALRPANAVRAALIGVAVAAVALPAGDALAANNKKAEQLANRYLSKFKHNVRNDMPYNADRHWKLYVKYENQSGDKAMARWKAEKQAGGSSSKNSSQNKSVSTAKSSGSSADAKKADLYLNKARYNAANNMSYNFGKHYNLYAKHAKKAGLSVLSKNQVKNGSSSGTSSASSSTSSGPVKNYSSTKSAGGAKLSSGRSGLSWASGMSCFGHSSPGVKGKTQPAFESWRGRKIDVAMGWAPRDNQAKSERWLKGGGLGAFAGTGARAAVSVPLLFDNTAGQFSNCANGKFDDYFRTVGQQLKAKGVEDAVVRLGWEANGSWFPWSIGNDVSGYKSCFKRAVNVMRSQAPKILIEWPLAKKGHLSYDVDKAYPGGDVVDIIGVTLYDRYTSASNWKAFADDTHNGGPFGPEAWADYARSKGKKLAVGEWGVSDGYRKSGSRDNPDFIEYMVGFFKKNSDLIAYEAYYNCQTTGIYRVFPESQNPKAGAAYKNLYRKGG